MKKLNITCPLDKFGKPDSGKCHENTAKTETQLLSMLHKPNNHILIMKQDYDNTGTVKDTTKLKALQS